MSILCNFRAVAVGVGGFLLSLPQIVAGPTASDFLAAFSQAGSHFEVNRGQLPADVAYTFRSTDYRIDLVPHGMNLALPENAVRLGDPMQVRFAGSDGTGELTGEEALPFSVMHRVPDGQGRSRMTSVSTFSRVKEVSLYEGIEDKLHTPYTSAKGALLAMTHGLANDLGTDGIRVNMVSPCICWNRRDQLQPKDFFEDHSRRTPLLGRNAEAKDVANVIMFYASELSGFVTGTHLPVCGGLVMCVG